MDPLKIGLLPLYLKLYDDAVPELRSAVESFVTAIVSEFAKRKVEVIRGNICRLEAEFTAAIRQFENEDADALVTLHLAYSPSLESASALAKTALPVIVLDTTPDVSFGPETDPDRLMNNHGIHGVQDMCNLLIRNQKRFQIEAGHWKEPGFMDRVVSRIRSARIAKRMKSSRVGRIGRPFPGMGDFAVESADLTRDIGIAVVAATPQDVAAYLPGKEDPAVLSEITTIRKQCNARGVSAETLLGSLRTGLAVRRWIEKENLSAFSVNFLEITAARILPAAPFLEACNAMGRGIGYAGEGDVLTAALIGALLSVYPQTTFAEMFCPDWKSNRIFLSHMGEVNINLVGSRPRLLEKNWPYTDAMPPVSVAGCLKPGKAAIVDLAPGPNKSYSLIVAPVQVVSEGKRSKFGDLVRGWIKPAVPVGDFLAAYSREGGTHHLGLVYGNVIPEIIRFGEIMGWRTVTEGL